MPLRYQKWSELASDIFDNVRIYLMFAVVKRRQIWVERRQERARYTLLYAPSRSDSGGESATGRD